jgi:hypothetical protein
MELNHRAAGAKQDEIRNAAMRARRSTTALPDDAIDATLAAFANVTPPQEPEVTFDLITISSPYSAPKAQSRKPGNVLLNWRKLIDIVPDISLAGLGAATLPVAPAWSAVLAGLYIWNKVWRGSTEDFSDAEAMVILALWKHRDSSNKISESEGFTRTNELRASYSLSPQTQAQFSAAIDRLVAIDCIALEGGIIWLREWVRVKYS